MFSFDKFQSGIYGNIYTLSELAFDGPYYYYYYCIGGMTAF